MVFDKTHLVLNLGLKSIRAIVFSKNGKMLFCRHIPVATIINRDFVEQDPEEWWRKTKSLLSELAGIKKIARTIDGITVTSSASCLVSIDEKGKNTCNAIMVFDKRAKKEAEYIKKLSAFRKLERKLKMGMSAYHMLPKILWLKKNKPSLYKKTKYFLSINDYLNYKLTGVVITDNFNACKCHFDTNRWQYPLGLLKAAGLSVSAFPEVQKPGYVIGCIKSELSKRFNLDKNIPVVLSTYDAICAFFGSTSGKNNVACDMSGTVTSVRISVRKKTNTNFENLFNYSLKSHEKNIVGASTNLGGGLIEWAKQTFYAGENNPYELMEKEASESLLGARGLIFMPYLLGERAPLWDDNVRGIFFGIERFHTRRDFIRAIFESAAFITNDLIREMKKNKIKVKKIRLSGGLSRIGLISQIKADVTGKKVELLNETETTSIGAVFFLLLGKKVYSDLKSMVPKFIKVRKVFKPDNARHKNYKKFFNFYKKLYLSTRKLFKIREKMIKDIYRHMPYTIENL